MKYLDYIAIFDFFYLQAGSGNEGSHLPGWESPYGMHFLAGAMGTKKTDKL